MYFYHLVSIRSSTEYFLTVPADPRLKLSPGNLACKSASSMANGRQLQVTGQSVQGWHRKKKRIIAAASKALAEL